MECLQLRCPCGELITADDEDGVVAAAEAHLAQEHPRLVGVYQREHFLAFIE